MPRRRGVPGRGVAIRNDFHQLIFAHEGQLLPGHLQHFQVKAREGAGAPGARRQARAQVRLVGPACRTKSRFVAKQCLDLGLPGFTCHHQPSFPIPVTVDMILCCDLSHDAFRK